MTHLLLLALLAVQQPPDYGGELPRLKPTEAAEAIKTFTLAPGYRIELVASEPQVASPVDLSFDEEGRLWVVEMVDYPFNESEGNPPQGRVVRLEDKDGDGRFETRVVIAEKISCPTGLALWDGGAFVTAPPVLLYVKEGVRRVVQTGFGVQNIQGLANNPKWGLDNWFHAAGGTAGGQIVPAGVGISGRDFRFRPTGEFEPLSGGGQFGNSFDDFGRRFVCSNANSARHVVLEDAVLRHNPYFAVPAVTASIAAEGDAGKVYRTSAQEPWRVLRTRLRREGQIRGPVEDTTFTSATGIFYHKGRLYVGEVAHNLISRKSLSPNGSTFRAERIDKDGEFLTSTDNWFRPCNFATGPDGALYVCDMYRECIEHPHSLPDFIKKHLDLTSGKERGRIWRIIEADGPTLAKPQLRTAEDLAAALARPEAWWRTTASRLLFQRQDKAAAPLIEKLLASPAPEVRAAALWALDGLGVRKAETLLKDPSPDVREQAVRLAPLEALMDLADDAPRVRLALACRLAESQDPRARAAVEKLKPGADRWLQTAISIASGEKSAEKTVKSSPASQAPVQVGDRKQVVESYRAALEKKGDAVRGREVYRKNCVGCHRSLKEGNDVGPDFSTVKQKTPEELLISILDPNREVAAQYVAVRILTTSGAVLDGLIAAETATSVTIKRQGGEVDTILKVRIEKLVKSTLSLMPEGFEKVVDPQQMADLIQFLKE